MTADKDPTTAPRLPSKRFVALLYVPLLLPAMLPLYFARDQEDPVLVTIMVGTTVAILVGNAFVLVGMYRWFSQGGGA